MKDQIDLDALFHKAGNQPAVSSFGETKELFLNTYGTNTVTLESGKTSFFTLKKLMIMITILSSIFLAIFLFPNEEVETIETPQAKVEVEVEVRPEIFIEPTPVNDTKKVVAVGTVSHKKEVLMVVPETETIEEVVQPQENPMIAILSTFKQFEKLKAHVYKKPYDFPKLTKEQIEANNKRKKKMLKALSKFSKKSYAFVPSGSYEHDGKKTSVQAFHMQNKEVSNVEYRTFLFDLLIQGRKDDFLIAKPDQTLWTKSGIASLKEMQDKYFSNIEFNDYPVNNISRAGAELYCRWLTIEVRKSGNKDCELINDVRIPQRAEWEYASTGDKPNAIYPWTTKKVVNEDGCFLANFDVQQYSGNLDSVHCDIPGDTTVISDGALMTARVGTYNPNWFGMWNMSGNVAEMVYGGSKIENNKIVHLDPGTAGGGWMSSDIEIQIFGEDPHAGLIEGNLNVGFRVVISHLKKIK